MNHLTQTEIKALLDNIPDERKKLMFKVGFLHGLRVSELINLTKEDIRDGYVKVQRLKGSLKTVQPFVNHPDAELDESAGLKDLFGTLSKGERLFPWTRNGVFKMMKKAGEKAGLPEHKCHPHTLKHSCAMVVIGTGIENARQYLGHKNISSTGAYVRVSDEVASKAFAGAFA
jgi:integrase